MRDAGLGQQVRTVDVPDVGVHHDATVVSPVGVNHVPVEVEPERYVEASSFEAGGQPACAAEQIDGHGRTEVADVVEFGRVAALLHQLSLQARVHGEYYQPLTTHRPLI